MKQAGRAAQPVVDADLPPQGLYAGLLTGEERIRATRPASLDDELALLRSCIYRLARRLQLQDEAADDLKLLQTLVAMIRAVATLERAKALQGAMGGALSAEFLRAVAALDACSER